MVMNKFDDKEYQLFAQDCFMRLVSRASLTHPVDDKTLAENAMFAFKCAAFYFAAWELERARLEGKNDQQERQELAQALREALTPNGTGD
jgi:hypothetical protein